MVIIKIKSKILFLLLALKNLRFLTGPKPKGENLTIYNEFIQFNEKYFNNISINGKNLSSIQFIKIKDFYKFYRLI